MCKYVLFDRFREAYDRADFSTALSRVESVKMDIINNLEIYIPLLVLVLLWLVIKAISVVRKDTETRDLIKAINALNKRLDDNKATKSK